MADGADANNNFFWDNQPWIISDNSTGGDAGLKVLDDAAGKDQDKGKKVLHSSNSNSPNTLGGDVSALVKATKGKKKGGAGGGSGCSGSSKKASGGGGVGKGGSGGESDHEIHIWTERERRKKMRNMFSTLHSLLPHLPPKADKSTIVDEAVSYIKTLQQSLQDLQKRKLERLRGMSTMNNFAQYPSRSLTQQNLALMNTRESFMADQVSSSSNNMAIINSANPSPASSFSNVPRFSPMSFQIWTSPSVVLNVCGDDAQIGVCSFKKPGMFSMICYILDKYKLEVVSASVSGDDKRMHMIHTRGNYTDYQFPEGFRMEEAFKAAAAEILLWVTNSS